MLGADWRLLSYLIALALLVGAALEFIGQGVASRMLVGVTAGIAVPIWAFLLARGSTRLTERT